MRIDRSQSKQQLTDGGLHAQGRTRVGETRYALTVRTNTGYFTRSQGTGACVWIENVEVVVGFPSVDVRIASDYAPTSCAYRSILAHENRHVAIAREHVARYAPRFRQALDSLGLPTGRAPWATAALSDTQRQVDAELERLLKPTFDQLWAEMNRAQATIDTPEAYAAEQRACNDW